MFINLIGQMGSKEYPKELKRIKTIFDWKIIQMILRKMDYIDR